MGGREGLGGGAYPSANGLPPRAEEVGGDNHLCVFVIVRFVVGCGDVRNSSRVRLDCRGCEGSVFCVGGVAVASFRHVVVALFRKGGCGNEEGRQTFI